MHIITYSYSRKLWITCCITMTIQFILLFNLLVVSAYNIDTNYPILYPDSATNINRYIHTNFQRSYFGYSVLLHHDFQKNISWLLIGAPRGNYTGSVSKELDEPGVVYRCSLPGSCEEIEPAVIKDENVFYNNVNMLIYKKRSWFGAAMSIERNSGFFTICAPRTNRRFSWYYSWQYVNINLMEGVCYSDRISSTTVMAETSDIRRINFSKKWWYHTMHGFSVSFESPLDKKAKNISRIIGRPSDEENGSVNVASLATSNFDEIYSKDTHSSRIVSVTENSKFGYTVTSGYYFAPTQSLFACADPGWNQTGQVAVMKTNEKFTSVVARLYGSDIGEFFGASLTTGDLNNDGLHDLVIGAPHWGNDHGRIYIYLGSSRKEFEAAVILEGAKEDGEFGYAVASGDLDGDGFSDIIVSAPWEDSGVIYVYNGNADLKDKVRPVASQRIMIQGVQTFGFSISEPVDIDNNGYADIAVGAYKSGHVTVLRSKPIVRTDLTVSTDPSILQKNISSFFLEACVQYHGYDMAYTHPFKISLIIDKKYQRTKKTSLELFSTDPPIHTCVNISIPLVDNIQDFIEPIVIYASHNFSHNNSSAHKFCKTCPVESRDRKARSTQILLPFDIECGEDRICHSNISATMKFCGIGENDSWMIGSNDIALETHLQNHAEPAYLTKIIFTFPDGIVLRSILPFCEEDTDGDALMIICSVGNPFETDEQKVIKLDLDMRQLTNSSLHGRVLEFFMEIQTHSVNRGINMTKSLLTLQSEVSLLLNGNVIEEDYYIPALHEDQLNITFRHIYQIFKFGATSLEEAQLVVNVPSAMNDLGSFVVLYKPQIFISGKNYYCSSNGIDLIDVQQDEFQENITSNANNLNNNNETLNHTLNVMHNIFKRDTSRRTSVSYMSQKLSAENMPNSTILNDNLAARESDVIYVNCSVYGINCSTVHCNLSALKTQKDVGKLVMQLTVDVKKFKDIFGLSEKTKIVQFSTDAYVEIIQPANRIPDVDTRRNVTLTTKFSFSKREKLQMWIVPVSISLGFILLCVVIIFLNRMGFFKRMTNEELLALKTREVTENVNEMEVVDAIE
ncbi:integrin alpha-9-like [Linepithema humile]|uniref:integrin alpha-9-like n=1 Tax=Linepithema humile TaxID=83485 RepID=UPI00062358CB|nr:PREDICTED: integrin alpha-9-like [Linepithema humile]